MKKLLLLLCFLFINKAFASDSTIVVSHNGVVIKTNPSVGNTIYPSWATFPAGNKQYRKVLMQLKFECAPGLKCGEWDYINSVIIGRKGTVFSVPLNYEIGRFITPYGFYWNSSMNWQHSWYYDVTDFAMLLHDSVEVIYKHTGYESNSDRGWKINLKFICIEGTPVCEPVNISKLWDGSYAFGNNADSIEKYLMPVNTTLNGQTNIVRFKAMNTGHGSDSAAGCMEFCRKYRQLLWDGNIISQKDIWRNDCGSNAVYPQAGTWIYDRAGWCPGSPVRYDDVNIVNVAGGSTHTIDMNMEPYTGYANHGNLYTTAYIIEYKAPANTNDVSLETIMAPSPEVEFKRMNPICNNPVIVIRNNGGAPLTSVTIEYGVQGKNPAIFDWKGNLALMQSDTIKLTNPVNWGANNGKFTVTLKNPNGQTDQYADDNTLTSDFIAPEIFPSKIIVHFMSNKDASENSYKIVNATTNTIHYEKSGFTNEKLYLDTIDLSPGACYNFYFSDEGKSTSVTNLNKDGLDFPFFTPYEGTGVLRIKNGNTGAVIKDITGLTAGPYNTGGGNFGTSYSLYFTSSFGLGFSNNATQPYIEVYPNPVTDKLYINYNTPSSNGNIYLIDMQGRVLYNEILTKANGTCTINTGTLVAGVYTVKVITGAETVVQKITKQ